MYHEGHRYQFPILAPVLRIKSPGVVVVVVVGYGVVVVVGDMVGWGFGHGLDDGR